MQEVKRLEGVLKGMSGLAEQMNEKEELIVKLRADLRLEKAIYADERKVGEGVKIWAFFSYKVRF